ncbi:hypothetical protein ZWY2020_030442 [Hordeum vulgare]|nr:hypothetical protein ZWY2020_030442 [Hordeum vulgare]
MARATRKGRALQRGASHGLERQSVDESGSPSSSCVEEPPWRPELDAMPFGSPSIVGCWRSALTRFSYPVRVDFQLITIHMCREKRWDGRCRHRRSRCADGWPRASWLRACRAATGTGAPRGARQICHERHVRDQGRHATQARRGESQRRPDYRSRPHQRIGAAARRKRKTMKATLKRLFFSSREGFPAETRSGAVGDRARRRGGLRA